MKKIIFSLFLLLSVSFPGKLFAQISTHVVISEIYGGGGNAGASFVNDYIELYNPTNAPVNLSGWSVQYASAAGTSWQVTTLTGTIQAKGFLLIKEASGGTPGLPLPSHDVTGTINMSGTAGKVLLSSSTTAGTGALPVNITIIDFVGFGTTASNFEGAGRTPAPSNTLSVERKASSGSTAASLTSGGLEEFEGNGWDSNNNNLDFVAQAPQPQNSSSTEPVIAATLSPNPLTLNFGTQTISTTSTPQSYALNYSNLNSSDVTATATGPYILSKTAGGIYSSVLVYTTAELTGSSTNISVKFTPTTAGAAPGSIANSGGGASTQTVTLTGTGQAPFLSAAPTALNFPAQNVNTTSSELTYVLGYGSLNGTDVTLTTSVPYSISKTSGGSFGTSLTYTNAELSGSSTNVYVRFTPTTAGSFPSSISNAGGGASTETVTLTGSGQSSSLAVMPSSLSFGNQTVNSSAVSQTYTVSGTNLTADVTVNATAPFEVSKDNITFSSGVVYTLAQMAATQTVYVRFSPTVIASSNGTITNTTTGAAQKDVNVSGTGTAVPVHVVISEIYGGGGNSGAILKNDFIELYNPTAAAIDLAGWSVQYTSAAGTAWQVTPLTGSIPAKGYYLVQEAQGTGGTVSLPTPDASGTISMSGTAGKVLLASTTTAQTGVKPAGAAVIDLIGFGTAGGYEGASAAPAPSNTASIERKATATSTPATLTAGGSEEFSGNGYDSDVNGADFVVQVPNPQNSLAAEPLGASHVVISEVYGGGGNSGSVYKSDFIELYNPTNSVIDLTGWSVQYASAAGTSWAVTPLAGSIGAKGFYLVQEATGTGGTTSLPTPDAIGSLAMAGTAGKVLLSNSTVPHSGSVATGPAIIDFVGFGATANAYEGTGPTTAPSNTSSVERKASATSTAVTLGTGGTEEFTGNGWDSDDNAADFVARAATPQNSTITEPASMSGPYFTVLPTSLAFGNQNINTTSGSKTYVLSAGNLTNPATVMAAAPFSISKDNITFSTALSYSVADLSTSQTVYVRFSPVLTGNSSANVSHSSAGAVTVNLGLTGAGVDPNQTVFNFENCTTVGIPALSDGFTQYSITGPQTWGCTTTFGHDAADATGAGSAGNALQINGFSGGNIQNQDWLISPALNLSSMTYAVLSFWTRSAFAGDKLMLKVSTTYSGSGDPSLAVWTDIDGKFPEANSNFWKKSDNIDLTAYKAAPVYVAIVYNSTTSSASRWTVDDFAVNNSATPPPVDITTPASAVNFGFQAAGSTSAERTFVFSAGNLTGDVTLTAPVNFTISKSAGGTFSNAVTYSQAAINNTSPTVYVKFSPPAVNTNYSASIVISTSGSANKSVALLGNTFDTANSLEVVNWNIEWFGHPSLGPSNNAQQATNVRAIIDNLNADLYGFAEVVDTALFRSQILPPGYNVVFSDFGSYANDKLDADYPLSQKLAFMYRTSMIRPLSTFGVLRDTYLADTTNKADGTPFKNWSSGRFPYAMQAAVSINGKIDTVYFMEIHAKANTGNTAEQNDAYDRRKGGNLQFKTWLDANLPDKKILILGDFNDVLDPDKTIAPKPPGTGTSYSDFTNDQPDFNPVTLPLSLAGKQSTAGFPTVIDNVIISNELTINYIPASADVLDAVKNLVTNYTSTTTDHYPVFSRYLFGNGAPAINAIPNQVNCFTASSQMVAVTGISAGPEASQSTSLSITSDNANLFDLLTIQPDGSTAGVITYRFKNNVNGTANVTVTVTDNGGTDFGGINQASRMFTITERSAATATVTGTAAVCTNGASPTITFSGATGTAPYTFTYNINGGASQTLTTSAGNTSVSLAAPTGLAGSYIYSLLNVADANCGQAQTGSATVTVRQLPTAAISGTTTVSVGQPAPFVTFTGATGTAPYTFTYKLNGGANNTITTTGGNSVSVAVPANTAGTYSYSLVSVSDANCGQLQSGTATVTIRPLPSAAISGTAAVCVNSVSPVVTFTGLSGVAPYTFTYTVNSGTPETITTSSATATINVPANAAGLFTYALISVSDANASQAQSGNASVAINALPDFQIASNSGTTISKGDILQLNVPAAGGTVFSWSGADIISVQNTPSITARPKQSGNYTLTVTNSSGCSASRTIAITVMEDYKLESVNIMTPNGDGINDYFIIRNIDLYPNNTLRIFNRSGRVLYTKQSYNNDWNGTINGSPLTEGTYYYVLDYGPEKGSNKGFFSLIR